MSETMTDTKYYTVVTFGVPTARYPAYRRTRDAAIRDASRAMGSGTCNNAYVIECDTLEQVQRADISRVEPGTRIVHSA